jgi:hypothetical protein
MSTGFTPSPNFGSPSQVPRATRPELESIFTKTFISELNASYTGQSRHDYDRTLPTAPLMFWTKPDLAILREYARLQPAGCPDIKILPFLEDPNQTECKWNLSVGQESMLHMLTSN